MGNDAIPPVIREIRFFFLFSSYLTGHSLAPSWTAPCTGQSVPFRPICVGEFGKTQLDTSRAQPRRWVNPRLRDPHRRQGSEAHFRERWAIPNFAWIPKDISPRRPWGASDASRPSGAPGMFEICHASPLGFASDQYGPGTWIRSRPTSNLQNTLPSTKRPRRPRTCQASALFIAPSVPSTFLTATT